MGGGGVGGDSVVRVGGSTMALLPVAGSLGSPPNAIGAIASDPGATGSATAGSYLSAIDPPGIDPPDSDPPDSDPPDRDPPDRDPPGMDPPASELAAGGCRLASPGPGPAAAGSRICGGSQLLRSAAAGYAADRSARNSAAVGRRLGSLDRLRLTSGRSGSGMLSMFGLPCTTR